MQRANTLTYYVYTNGMLDARFSYATAIGLILSVVSATLMVVTNATSRKLSGKGLY